MVGVYREKIRRPEKIPVAEKQWLHHDLPAFEHGFIYLGRIPGHSRYSHADIHCRFQLCDFSDHQSGGHAFCVSCALSARQNGKLTETLIPSIGYWSASGFPFIPIPAYAPGACWREAAFPLPFLRYLSCVPGRMLFFPV